MQAGLGVGAGELQAAGRDRRPTSCEDCDARLVIGDDTRLRAGARQRAQDLLRWRFRRSLLDEGPFTPLQDAARGAGDVPLHVGLDRAGPRAWCCRTTRTSGRSASACAGRCRSASASLVAAPLYHMNGLAMCQTTLQPGRHHRAAAAVHHAGLRRGRRTPSRGLPDLGADHDRHAAARARAAGRKRPLAPSRRVRMGSAPDHPGADRPGAQRLSQGRRSPTATAPPRRGPSCSVRTPRACRSPSCRPAIRIPRSSCGWCATARRSRTRACSR